MSYDRTPNNQRLRSRPEDIITPLHQMILKVIKENRLWKFNEVDLRKKADVRLDHILVRRYLDDLIFLGVIHKSSDGDTYDHHYEINRYDTEYFDISGSTFHIFPEERDLAHSLINLDIRSMNTIAKTSEIKPPNLSNWSRSKGTLSSDAIYNLLKTLGAENFIDIHKYTFDDTYNSTNTVVPLLSVNKKSITHFNTLLYYLHIRNQEIYIERISDNIITGKFIFLISTKNGYYSAIILIPANPTELNAIIPIPSDNFLWDTGDTLNIKMNTVRQIDDSSLSDIINNKLSIDKTSLKYLLDGKPDPFHTILNQDNLSLEKDWKDVRAIATDYGLSAEDIFNCIRKKHCSRS